MNSIRFFLLFFVAGINLQAQTSATRGVVLDEKSRKPVAGASIYISNSSFGTICSDEGLFNLSAFPAPPYLLTISAVGYETATWKIEQTGASDLVIVLKQRASELAEVVVRNAEKNGWQRYGREFLEDFIGYSDFARACKLINPEVLSFFYDKNNNRLTVYAEKPLLIRNAALGYTITYWLEDFVKEYNTRVLFYRGSSQFTNLMDNNTKKGILEKWTTNRRTAYNGSLQHFIHSLYHNQLAEDGFEVRTLQKIKLSSFYDSVPRKLDTVFFNNANLEQLFNRVMGIGKASGNEKNGTQANLLANNLLEVIKRWYNDTADHSVKRLKLVEGDGVNVIQQIYEFKKDELNAEKVIMSKYPSNEALERQAKNGVINVLGAKPVDASIFITSDKDESKSFSFNDYLHITYHKESEEEAYQKRIAPYKPYAPVPPSSIVSMKNVNRVAIYSNGHHEPSSGLFLELYWSYEKLDKLLPLDYK